MIVWIAWIAVACWSLVALARLAGADRLLGLAPVLIPAMAALPYVAAGAVVPIVVAALARDRAAIVAAVVVAALFAGIVLPRAAGSSRPPAHGPHLRVLTANLLFGRAGDADLVDLVRRTGADVLSVQEFTPEAAARLDAAGIGRLLPYRVLEPRGGPAGTGLYARYPLTPLPEPAGTTFAMASAALAVPGAAPVRITAVHPPAPLGADVPRWARDLRRLPGATPDGPVRVLAGDFNASLDHAAFRAILRHGYADAADRAGRALVPTYRPFPPITIDHVLADRRCAVLRVKVFFQPASDHRALLAELRLP